jgi:hypothetical protein
MQVNELVGQVQQGTRHSNDTPAMLETRAERRGAGKSRRTVTRLTEGTWQHSDGHEAVAATTRKPRLFGAGF